ncbi:MAG TPA: PGPGW domain-containing protein [Verrucomicrobiae bacterium]
MNVAGSKNLSSRIQHALRLDELSTGTRKIVIGIAGGLVLLAGIALLVLPGPAFIVIPLGLAILATEFAWARHYLQTARGWYEKAKNKSRKKKKSRSSEKLPGR